MSSDRLKIYTDGSCVGNPGKGGWGFIVVSDTEETHVYGGEKQTTNNKMELTAVIEALKMYSQNINFHIFSDSLYVINCAKGKWKRKANLDFWSEYDKVSRGKNIIFEWVKGHNGDKYNEMVDKLAKKGTE